MNVGAYRATRRHLAGKRDGVPVAVLKQHTDWLKTFREELRRHSSNDTVLARPRTTDGLGMASVTAGANTLAGAAGSTS